MKLAGFVICLIIFGCSKKDQPDLGAKMGEIYSIKSLSNISLGQTDTITVSFGGGSGCSSAHHLEAKIIENTISFTAYYVDPPDDRVCPAVVPTHQLKYFFKPGSKGIYTYKSANNSVSTASTVN
ncbi:hypothetical protein [Daejeonella oryzae]|uniref:hypothetical protein n=1 Tax=Daejeonella oryzae TaxID=1122943 RepID=UPI00047D762E|nr:hypothetical protein [Daejeonella oryzae]